MIQVLIVDDHPIIRESLVQYVVSATDMAVTADVADGRAAVAAARETHPDVVLMDLSLPVMDGITATYNITQSTTSKVLILSSLEHERDVLRALHSGAQGYLTKVSPAADVLSAIRKVHIGGLAFNHTVEQLLGLSGETSKREQKSLIRRFATGTRVTSRQMAVLRGVCQGRSNGDIAKELGITISSINTYVSRLYDKLGADSRVSLYKAAVEEGLVEQPSVKGQLPLNNR